MAKNIWGDIGDQFLEIVEQGAKTTGNVAKASTVGAVQQAVKELTGTSFFDAQQKSEEQKKPKNFTEIDEKKLKEIENNYKKQDDVQLEQMRQRLHNLVQSDSQKAYQNAKQTEEERLQKIEEEEIQRMRQEAKPDGLPMPSSKASRGKMANKQAIKQATNSTEMKSGNKQ